MTLLRLEMIKTELPSGVELAARERQLMQSNGDPLRSALNLRFSRLLCPHEDSSPPDESRSREGNLRAKRYRSHLAHSRFKDNHRAERENPSRKPVAGQ
jgi:hypothetical protein